MHNNTVLHTPATAAAPATAARTKEQFVALVVGMLVAEHGGYADCFADFVPEIEAAYATEGGIDVADLELVVHGPLGSIFEAPVEAAHAAGGANDPWQDWCIATYPLLTAVAEGGYDAQGD